MMIFTQNDLTRRSFMALAGAALIAPMLPGKAVALNTAEARALIDRAVTEINGIINSGRSERQMYGDFERIFARYADVPTIARSALGPVARSASASQVQAFGDAFSGYMARKYGQRFREFIGGEIRVTDARPLKNFFEVKAVADLRGQPPFAVSFMVSARAGSDKFVDRLIEGISLLKTERTEIGAMRARRRGNVDAVIAALKALS